MAKAGIIVGVAAVVIVAAVLVVALPSSTSGATSAVAPVASGSAISAASSVAGTHDAGSLLVGIGIAPTFSFSFGKETGNSTCPLTDALSTNFTVPETTNYSAGTATLWLFLYYNSATPSESAVAVVGTTTYFLGMTSGSQCVEETTLPTVPSDAISSTTAATQADHDAGSFLAADPSANGVYVLAGNTTTGSEWLVLYTNCSYDLATDTVTGGNAANAFEAEVDGSTGAVEASAGGLGDFACSDIGIGGSSPTYSLGMVEIASSGAGSTYDALLALSPTGGLETSMFGLEVMNSHGTIYPLVAASGTDCSVASATNVPSSCTGTAGGWYAVLVGASGYILAIYAGSSGWSYVSGSTVALGGADTLEIVTAVQIAGNGYTLTVYSTGSATVSGSASL